MTSNKMRKLFLITVILLSIVNPLKAQLVSEYDGIELTVHSDCPKVFYEGQSIHFSYSVKNNSGISKTFEGRLIAGIEKIIDLSNNQELVEQNVPVFIEHNPNLVPKESPKTIVPANFDKFHTNNLGYKTYGNKKLSDFIPIKDTSSTSLPIFFKPGNYKVFLKLVLRPSNKELLTSFTFEVKAAKGKVEEDLKDFMNAFMDDMKLGFNFNREKPYLSLKLYEVAHSVESPYAVEAFHLLTTDYRFNTLGIFSFRSSYKAIFEMYELIPQYKKCEATYTAYWFINGNISKIGAFKEAGYISDINSYLKNYLKRISHLDEGVSDFLIEEARRAYNITDLTNYASQKQ